MTNDQKEKITELRKIGIGYRSIAMASDLSRDIVRNYCEAQGLDGYGSDIKKKPDEEFSKEFCKYYCGKEFESRASQANFCCRKCFIRNRFWRKEDVAEVVRSLEEGIPIQNAPGWIKNLIMGIEDKEADEI